MLQKILLLRTGISQLPLSLLKYVVLVFHSRDAVDLSCMFVCPYPCICLFVCQKNCQSQSVFIKIKPGPPDLYLPPSTNKWHKGADEWPWRFFNKASLCQMVPGFLKLKIPLTLKCSLYKPTNISARSARVYQVGPLMYFMSFGRYILYR